MILIEKTDVTGFEQAVRGMRNPMNSWIKSDSSISKNEDSQISIGANDHKLMMELAKRGSVHGKFRRMINLYSDVTAPLYWWKEFDTYKIGTVTNSCSTMHNIHKKEFTIDDFSHEHLLESTLLALATLIEILNLTREAYLEMKDKKYWWQMIQLLPSSYNQKRTIMLNYEVLAGIYKYRKDHKLDEWKHFCQWIETLPYSWIAGCYTSDTFYKDLKLCE